MNERKARLVAAIKTAHPELTVETEWSMFDNDISGISISASHAETGNVLAAGRRDDELDAMDEAAILAWVEKSVMEFEGRQRKTRHAIKTEREMGR